MGDARMQLTNQDLEKIKLLARQWGEIISEEAFGPEGPGLDFSFTDIEDVWVAAAEGLSEGVACAALGKQAENMPTEQPCPQCGASCELDAQERTMQAQGAKVSWSEAKCYCQKCRRSFFPSACCLGD